MDEPAGLMQPNKRLTVGLLVNWADSEYQMKIINGAVGCARENNLNLLCIEGGAIYSASDYENARNIVYDLVNLEELSGIILMAAAIGYTASQEQMVEFSRRFHPLPLVSIGQIIEGCSAIMIDNSTGLRELLLHMSQVHRRRRFAYIKGPDSHPHAVKRFETFKTTLADLGIPFDPALVVEGDFLPLSGARAIETLLDERRADLDVIVAANDEMALGALSELNLRGIKVPDDIALVGFDNIEGGASANPPLTTVNQSLEEQGRLAVAMLLDLILKKEPPTQVLIPTRATLRESCGCLSQATRIGALGLLPELSAAYGDSFPAQHEVAAAVLHEIQGVGQLGIDWEQFVPALVTSLYRELVQEDHGRFLKTAYELLDQVYGDEDVLLCQNIVSELRHQLLPRISDRSLSGRIEDLMHQLRVMIGEKAVLKGKISYHQAMQINVITNLISEELLSIVNVVELEEILTRRLPQLKISAGYILEFTEHTQRVRGKNRLIMAFNRNGPIETADASDSFRLIPNFIRGDSESHAMAVMPLVFARTQFGLLVLEIGFHNHKIYETLRRIISSTLNGVLLTKQVQEHEISLIAQKEHLRNLAEMRQAMEGFIRTISLTVEVKDPYTAGHQNRVAGLAGAIAREMKLPLDMIETVRMAAMVHDLGKISVPAEILNKPGKLTDLEFQFVKDHPRVAFEILKTIELQWPIAKVILQHHERLDGSGYPAGLKNGEIMLEAKIIAVADVIEAMASHRPYRPALGIRAALDEVERNQGVLYDPAVVAVCVSLFLAQGYQLEG